ncbi:MAG: SDR family NAD(P)-dependent oxidoreductase [Bacteroidales bacterium]|jgi:NADP-dependent 3-hydroxy acid dehydrogenase YdfG|nr:NAD(P)-dependent oxidoreductase [Bacteroidota bacterium]MBQ9508444.1 SDR family NAD(P)-dependent oxidoreductase [Bacteroidales bacterium]MBR2772597.1 SDR family NAD(P)-dependent oxidoreductase [Bacteroidales bacterium]MBR6062578.1 SDR family NAD(P)-dependent oxidoreductase [Bacteroidales bacterium]
MKNVFITGATSGFGEAIAYKLAQHNVNMIITGRTENKLKEVAQKIESTTQSKVLTLAFDVQDYAQCEKAINSIPEAFKPIDVLVNNAGLAVELNPVNAGAIEDWERMINTNIKGLLYVTRLISPQMIEQRKGHIINLGSTASHEIYYGGNVYCATKHAVLALTKGMRTDFLPYGIKVSQISPGAAETNFSVVRFHGDQAKADKVYEGYDPLVAEDIADVVDFVLTRPAHVCLNEIIMTPTAQFNGTIVRN